MFPANGRPTADPTLPRRWRMLAYAELPQAGTKLDYYPQNPSKWVITGLCP